MQQQIIRCTDIIHDLQTLLDSMQYSGLFILTDKNTNRLCLPLLDAIPKISEAKKIFIPSDDENKNLQTLSSIWEFLSKNAATRNSLLINLGGGMLTDIGGFAAASFKRGIRFINIPTTLLGAVDAAVGGKTGINFCGLKNEIGAFCPAVAVVIDSQFFRTLDMTNLLSGYAELLKHSLLTSPSTHLRKKEENPLASENELNEVLNFDFDNIDYEKLNNLLFDSILVKQKIVEQDPTEKGIRKALNLGHTFGHAFESLSHEQRRPIPHGYAVAYGLVCELYMSFIKSGFDKTVLSRITRFIKDNYGVFSFDCKQYNKLFELMQHDKKNETSTINFTLLKSVGKIEINQTADRKEIEETLDYFREI
jgi:3-dehydroquinate synthase